MRKSLTSSANAALIECIRRAARPDDRMPTHFIETAVILRPGPAADGDGTARTAAAVDTSGLHDE